MSTQKSLTPQVNNLLFEISEHGSQHLREAETDLNQTNVLLGEAIEKLSKNFMSLHDTIASQQAMLEAILSESSITPEACSALRVQSEEIGLRVNEMVTGLQFQDMTSQLIGRVQRRIAGLRDMLSLDGIEHLPDADTIETLAALKKINDVLCSKSAVLENELWKTVCQTHMESGDIELF